MYSCRLCQFRNLETIVNEGTLNFERREYGLAGKEIGQIRERRDNWRLMPGYEHEDNKNW